MHLISRLEPRWMPAMNRTQADALRRIRDHGPLAWCAGKARAGGAVSRLFDRMAADGLCTKAPHKITAKGRKSVKAFEKTEKCDICGELRSNTKSSCSMPFHGES